METTIIEATQDAVHGFNWGKFLVGRPDIEWGRGAVLDPEMSRSLLRLRGWGPDHLLVLDLETGEGAYFLHGGNAHADLQKHRIWVCPMFEPFLAWLYRQEIPADLFMLPQLVELPAARPEATGYRRPGRYLRRRPGTPPA